MLSSYFVGSSEPKNYPNFVSHSPSPTGVKAFYTYLDKEMDSVERWSHPPNLLSNKEENQLMVMIEPSITPDSDEIAEYIKFMESGHTIILLQENPRGLFDLQISFNLEESLPQKIVDKHKKKYVSEFGSVVFFEAKEQDEVLLQSENGRVIAIKRTYGDGQLIVANTPNWITNENILEEGHLPLMLSLFNEVNANNIIFNEYIHGQQSDTFVKVYPKWFLLFMLQGILLTLLVLWYQGKRFGQVVIPREETVRYSDERINAIAVWYLKGRRFKDSLQIQAEYVRVILQENWGVPSNKEWIDVDIHLEKRWKQVPQQEIHSFVQELSNLLQQDTVTKQEYMIWAKKLDQLRKEVEEG